MILSLVKQFRGRKLITFSISLFLFLAAFFLFFYYLKFDIKIIAGLTLIIALICFYLLIRSRAYQAINEKNLLEHLNRNNSEYQESAQLLLIDFNNLSPIKQLQREKILRLFEDDFAQGKLNYFQPKIKLALPLLLLLINLLLLSFGKNISTLVSILNSHSADIEVPHSSVHSNSKDATNLSKITKVEIQIIPPSYTGVDAYFVDNLEFNAIEGSHINWALTFSQTQQQYFFWLTGQDGQEMHKKGGHFLFEHHLKHTMLYRFSQQTQHLDGVYAVTMDRDKAPKIKIIQPNTSLIEIAKDEEPIFALETIITDDYAISDIKIIASVAKGSGEAVKFRDRTYRFSPSERIDESTSNQPYSEQLQSKRHHHYKKSWSLVDLEMEPGDEVYFSLLAIDNKQPIQQTTKSNSIIVKWLDEELIETTAEGIRINFQPEYFRSQRQIIIETEQLIADQKDLNLDDFQDTSRDLGHSQSDLKHKYGQYLGDEFGEGPGEQHGLADGYHGGESHSSGEATAGMNHAAEQTEEKHHEEEESHQDHDTIDDLSNSNNTRDLSGATELIQEFTHDHGTVEIGPLSQRDPKSWMKMAVNQMWQAELHLMLSEPEKALPYEYKAYNYLKQARQAERIYAKRLGFEPPPVSEDRRLSGELSDILQYKRNRIDVKDQQTDNALYQSVYRLLNQRRAEEQPLTKQQIEHFSLLSSRFLELSESRSILVKYATTAEKIAQTGTLNLRQCEQCVTQLKAKLWQLLPQSLGMPKVPNKYHGLSEEIEESYLNSLKEIEVLNE